MIKKIILAISALICVIGLGKLVSNSPSKAYNNYMEACNSVSLDVDWQLDCAVRAEKFQEEEEGKLWSTTIISGIIAIVTGILVYVDNNLGYIQAKAEDVRSQKEQKYREQRLEYYAKKIRESEEPNSNHKSKK